MRMPGTRSTFVVSVPTSKPPLGPVGIDLENSCTFVAEKIVMVTEEFAVKRPPAKVWARAKGGPAQQALIRSELGLAEKPGTSRLARVLSPSLSKIAAVPP